MKLIPQILVALSVALLGSCSKDKSSEKTPANETPADKASASDSDKASDKEAPPAGPDFSSWDMDGKAKAWQGSWLAKENGTIQAWTITGDKVQTWDGEEEKTFTLVVQAPCNVEFKDDSGVSYPRNFASVSGKLQFGAAGYRRGPEAIFCDSSGAIYTLAADGVCTQWKDDFGKWVKSEGECAIQKNEEGAEIFTHGDPNRGEFPIVGDAIVPKASFPTQAVEGDFAAAKAARDAKAAE